MAYIGRNPAIGTQKVLDSLESQFNGTLTTFDLRYNGVPTYPTISSSLIVSLGGVLQEPGEAYYVSSDTIVFATAPPAGTDCWILLYSEYGAAAGSGSSGGAVSVATGEPMGFEERTDSAISFDNATRTFTIEPASGQSEFVVWTKGTKRTYSSAQTVQIGTSTGLYYVYFDAFGALQYRTTYFIWDEDTPTAYIYWNATTATGVFVADERHGIVLDWQTHEYLHRTRGAVIANGFSISNYTTTGDGSADADAQFDLGNGTFFDEDLEVGITHSATPSAGTFTQVLTGNAEIPVYYMSGSEGDWVKDTATEFACKQSGTTLQYNSLSGSTWSTTAANDNRYVVSWVVATNEISAPVIAILGQDQYSSIGTAEEAVWGDLTLTNFPIFEFRPLWKIIFRTNSNFTNTPNAYIANVLDLREFSSTGIAGTIVNDHGLLSGLADDDHAQYLNTTVDRTGVTANISTTGNITAANLIATGQLQGPANFVIDPAAVGDDTGNVEIKGNLTVQGTTTTINSTTVDLDHLSLGDDEIANFGTDNDIQIVHESTGSKSIIKRTTTGDFYIQGASGSWIHIEALPGESSIKAAANGTVELYYDHSKKLETTNTGVTVTGALEVSAATNITVGGTALPSLTGLLGGSLDGTLGTVTMAYLPSAPNSPVQGQFYFNSLNQKAQIYTGSAFVDLVPSGGGGGGGAGSTDAQATFRKYTYSITSTTNAVSGSSDSVVTAGDFVVGNVYTIKTIGTTDFTAIGASANTVGVEFTATGAGTGTGDAYDTLYYATGGIQNIEVYVNGVKAVEGSTNDYVATTGTSVNFTANLASGDVVDIQVYELLTNDAYVLASGGTFTGNVGINTSTINNRLHIHSDANEQGILLTQGGNNYSSIVADANRNGTSDSILHIEADWDGTTTSRIVLETGEDTTNKDDGRIRFQTAEAGTLATAIRIDPDGRIALCGDHDPLSPVHIKSNINPSLRIQSVADGNLAIRFHNNSGQMHAGMASGALFWGIGTSQNLASSSTQFCVMRATGNVGIGTTNPGNGLGAAASPSLSVYSGSGARLGLWGNGSRWWYIHGEDTNALQIGARTSSNTVDSDYLTISTGGNVGIGTATPSQKLSVHGTGTVASFGNLDSGSVDQIDILATANYPTIQCPSSLDTLQIASLGNVQIAIDSNNNSSQYFKIVHGGKDGGGSEIFKMDEGGGFKVSQANPGWFNSTNHPILMWDFKTNVGDMMYMASGGNTPIADQMALVISDANGFKVGRSGWDGSEPDVDGSNEFFRIKTDGNVGIGINNPTRKLEVGGDIVFHNSAIVASYPDANNIDHFWHNDSGFAGTGGSWNFCSDTTYKNTGNSGIRMGGKLGMGATPSGTPASLNAFIALGDSDTGVGQDGDGQLELWTNNQEIIHLNTSEVNLLKNFRCGGGTSGLPGFNNTNQGIYMERGNGAIFAYRSSSFSLHLGRSNNGEVLRIKKNNSTQAGTLQITSNSTVALQNGSDYRLKTNIEEIPNVVSSFRQLRPCQFEYISEPGEVFQGFIAHELQEVNPKFASGVKDEVDENGDMIEQGVDTRNLVPLLTAALQEAFNMIDNLQEQINQLSNP